MDSIKVQSNNILFFLFCFDFFFDFPSHFPLLHFVGVGARMSKSDSTVFLFGGAVPG